VKNRYGSEANLKHLGDILILGTVHVEYCRHMGNLSVCVNLRFLVLFQMRSQLCIFFILKYLQKSSSIRTLSMMHTPSQLICYTLLCETVHTFWDIVAVTGSLIVSREPATSHYKSN
jgi:hypothetical protein